MFNETVLFIGTQNQNRPLINRLEFDLGARVDTSKTLASEAILAVEQVKFPLILINDVLAPGNLPLPSGIKADDYPKMSQYVIRRTRQSKKNSDTPIIAVIVPVDGYTVLKDYLDAGATHVYDGLKDNLSHCINLARPYLEITSK